MDEKLLICKNKQIKNMILYKKYTNKNKPDFINVGFEFTAAKKKGSKLVGLDIYKHRLSRQRVNLKLIKLKGKDWIHNNFSDDECGCEVPTRIITEKSNIIKYYKDFIYFVKKSGLTTNIKNSVCGLGGCHIHIDVRFMDNIFKANFLRNLGIFMTNYPQLNWAFNDCNDNINANSLLTNQQVNIGIDNIKSSCYDLESSFENFCDRVSTNSSLYKFKNNLNPLNAFLSNPLKIGLRKKFSLRYCNLTDSVELRIFDMPDNLVRYILHYDVAMAIYNYCFDITKENKIISLKYKNSSEYFYMNISDAICQFNECMSILKINKRRTKYLTDNIIIRLKWNKKSKYGFTH